MSSGATCGGGASRARLRRAERVWLLAVPESEERTFRTSAGFPDRTEPLGYSPALTTALLETTELGPIRAPRRTTAPTATIVFRPIRTGLTLTGRLM